MTPSWDESADDDADNFDPSTTRIDINDFDSWPVFMSLKEVAQVLRVNEQTVRRAVAAGTLPAIDVVGQRARRISKQALLGFMTPPESPPKE